MIYDTTYFVSNSKFNLTLKSDNYQKTPCTKQIEMKVEIDLVLENLKSFRDSNLCDDSYI